MLFRIRETEACDAQPLLYWDSIWIQRLNASGGYCDWILAGENDQPESRGGLRSEAALHTSTQLCLFTNARLPEGMQPPDDSGYRGGWWGNSIRLEGEPAEEFGSLLWTKARAPLSDRLGLEIQDICEDALAVLRDQGAVARTDVGVEIRRQQGFVGITVRHYDETQALKYDQQFDVLWAQAAQNAPMNYGDRGVFERVV